MTSNPKSYLSISLQILFSIFGIFLQFHPINTDIFHPRRKWPSWANWSCTDSSDLPWKAEHSSLHNPFSPSEWCLLSYKLSSTSCNILLSRSNNSSKVQCFLSVLILFPVPAQSCAHTWSSLGQRDTIKKWAELSYFGTRQKSSAFQRPRQDVIKAWKKTLSSGFQTTFYTKSKK